MTETSKEVTANVAVSDNLSVEHPLSSPRPFSTACDPGIVVDMEIQPGDPVDSQIIRNFMGEFEAASKKTTIKF